VRWPAASNVSANSTSNSSPMRPRSGIVSRRSYGTRMRRCLRRLQRRRRADDLAVSGGEAIEWFRRDSERGDEAWPAASSYEPERRKIGPRGPDDRRCRRRTLRGRSGRRSILPRAVSRESKTRSGRSRRSSSTCSGATATSSHSSRPPGRGSRREVREHDRCPRRRAKCGLHRHSRGREMGGDVFAREEHLVRRRRLPSHSSGLERATTCNLRCLRKRALPGRRC